MTWTDWIAVEPTICHGQPVFKAADGRPTRIMVYLVIELLEAGVSLDEILTRYYPQLTKDSIQAALHYAAELIKQQEYTPLTEVK